MHLPKIMVVMLALVFHDAHAQQTVDNRYKVSLTIDSIAVLGTQELAPQAKVEATPGAVYDANQPRPLTSGRSYQLTVSVTNPSGEVSDYTGSPRLRYETFGCSSASNLGVMTMTAMAGVPCAGPEFPGLLIQLLDASGNLISVNSYLFRMINQSPPPADRAVR